MLRSIAIGVVCLVSLAIAQQLKEGEFEPYNLAIKDINAGDFAAAIRDLGAWAEKFPTSEFSDTRGALYVQSYAGLNQPDKALAQARILLAKDLKTVFPPPNGQAMIIRLLYNATWAIAHSTNPTPEDIATGEKAARQLEEYDEPLAGVSAEKWAAARADMQEKAQGALLYIAMLPGIQAMAKRPPDCVTGDAAYTKALAAYPENAAISYGLGRAFNCEGKFPAAIYEFQRAVVLDATLGDSRNDAKAIRNFADNAYIKFHGSDEGLEQLKAQVKWAGLPPEAFSILTSDEVAVKKQTELEHDNPQFALWMKIRNALTAPDGDQFFASQLKDAAVPMLKGILVEAKPACRPSELFVAMASAGKPEVIVKLTKAIVGKPEVNTELQWEGVATGFSHEPLRLTMESSVEKVHGLKMSPCAPRPGRR